MVGLGRNLEAPPTRSEIARGALGVALVTSALSTCLFGECQMMRSSRVLGSILGEVGAAISDAGTQWMVFACAGVYFLAFAVLRRRLSSRRTDDRGQGFLRRRHWTLDIGL